MENSSIHLNKMSFSVAILHKVRQTLSLKWKMQVYNTHLLPYIVYCNIIWANVANQFLYRISIIKKGKKKQKNKQ